ncbi:hypothetical protein PRIPAC_82934 [Pristionchus pacificus]|uniref:Uncharacterized protein n=1 Tax=Pristionchus pacificus TaxID=54126 RepID=A0A2A6CPL4_PRIPA|nr:hypothetical protein PRIPAC_82934 [Pristionchus pacificus]|eukprot:PDM80060.1 hypothetical protein PRIPAC_32639 [Pristionchus pacificus]
MISIGSRAGNAEDNRPNIFPHCQKETPVTGNYTSHILRNYVVHWMAPVIVESSRIHAVPSALHTITHHYNRLRAYERSFRAFARVALSLSNPENGEKKTITGMEGMAGMPGSGVFVTALRQRSCGEQGKRKCTDCVHSRDC